MAEAHSDRTATVRPATLADLEAINDIYNHYVLTSTATYQLDPEPLEGRERWFASHDAQHPVLVATIAGRVVGWGSLSPFHPREAYSRTVEDSVYLHHDFHRRGIGSLLLAELLRLGGEHGHRAVIALIDSEQAASVAFHERHGFAQVGHLKEVGFKFGRWLDVVYMQRRL
jgi:phosphinothricin acetyltransferase